VCNVFSFGGTGANVNQARLISCSSYLNLWVEVLGLQVGATMSISELLNHLPYNYSLAIEMQPSNINFFFCFVLFCFLLFLETGFLCVALAVLELTL
jgi:hypothetical protein